MECAGYVDHIQGDSGATPVKGNRPGTPWRGQPPQCLTEFDGYRPSKGFEYH